MAQFPTIVKMSSININPSFNVISNVEALSGHTSVQLGDQHKMVLKMNTVPLTESEDRTFQIFRGDIRDYGLVEFDLSDYGVFKPIVNSSKIVTNVTAHTIGDTTVRVISELEGTQYPIKTGSYIQFKNALDVLFYKLYLVRDVADVTNSTFGVSIWNSGTAYAIGTKVVLDSKLYKALTANTNKNPETETTDWVEETITYTKDLNLGNGLHNRLPSDTTVIYNDLVGRFRANNGDWNAREAQLTVNREQLKTYTFELVEDF